MKGFRNSPYGERRIGAVTAIKARAPVLGGNFGVWGGLFSTFDCAVKGIRKKEDPYNASMSSLSLSLDFGFGGVDPLIGGNGGLLMTRICFRSCPLEIMSAGQYSSSDANLSIQKVIAGFFTGGALAVRGGMKAARNSAIGCACLLAVIEGVGIGIQRMMAENTRLDVSIFFIELPSHFICLVQIVFQEMLLRRC